MLAKASGWELNMNVELSSHLDLLFQNAPNTRKAFELKEELLANSDERYNDLLASGVSPENAYKNVVNSIGDVTELFRGLEVTSIDDSSITEEKIKQLAIIKTIAAGLYLFSAVVFFLFVLLESSFRSNLNLYIIGLIIMILIDIIPTCMLVYASCMYPDYYKKDDTIVENFKEWKSETKKLKSIKGAVLCVLWAAAVLLYFGISYSTWSWASTWMIFLVAVCGHTVVELLFRLKELK